MTRASTLFVLFGGTLLLAVPAIGAEAVEVRLGPEIGADAISAPVVVDSFELPAVAGIRFDGRIQSSAGAEVGPVPEPGGGAPEAQASSMEQAVADDSETRRAATAATAATGIAVLVGLAAYNWGALKFALAGLFMPLFSRIQSNDLLDNGVRQRVHEAVVQNPGVTIKEITALCSIGWGTAVYHLKRLETERLIVSERNRQFRRFFKNGGGIVNDAKAAYGELKNPTGHRIARSVLAAPGSCQKELCELVGISAPLAHKYLSRLAEAGLVEAQREWRTVKYFPTPRLQDLLTAPAAPTLAAPTPLVVAA